MGLPSAPPLREIANTAVQQGASGWPVYALQSALNDAAGKRLSLDGACGPHTAQTLVDYQTHEGLVADGKAGPATWAKLSAAVCRRLDRSLPLPEGIAAGFARGEGGDYGPAVNWTVTGGVDCGLWQYRCIGPPFVLEKLLLAFAPYRSGLGAMTQLLTKAQEFAHPHSGCPYSPLQLAVLYHNWQVAANQYFADGKLSTPTAKAWWAPSGVPEWAKTYEGWAKFYIGSIAGF